MKHLLSLVLTTVVFGCAPLIARAAETPAADVPKPEALWPKGAPGALGKEAQDAPTVQVFLPPEGTPKTATGVVVLPGGGYWTVAIDHEGYAVARFLNSLGVAAFVVNYRHSPRYQHPAPINDAQRALRLVRSRAQQYKLSPDRIGVMGFSAGGHLAATASTRFDAGNPAAADLIDRVSCRPDFTVLGYPVVSFVAPFSHTGSSEGLLGKNPNPQMLEDLSAEKRVTILTPPAFMFHTSEDNGVPAENSIAYYQALRVFHIPAELHIYEKGKHGVGLAPNDPILSSWSQRLTDWLKTRELLTPPAACKTATKGNSPVALACASAGIPAAKAVMRDMIAAAKRRGQGFECDSCHTKDGMAPGTDKRFAQLLKLFAGK
ncbi:MAG: alpha/beta hydrolase [Deltaproteobacteria bacterium]|nr:alpha/beta hydrolase [Deltaproteobacteria bacterium]